MVVLTKKAAREADAEWVMVGLSETKSVERGWVVVPDKKKPAHAELAEKEERIDKVLSCYGYCKRSEVKTWLRNERVTFEGLPVLKIDQKVVVRAKDGVMVDGKPVPPLPSSEKENDISNGDDFA